MIKRLSLLTLLAVLAATPAAAQLDPLTDPLPRTLDERSDKRLDRVEQTLREMRSILFQGRESGKAVVVQPAETQSEVAALTRRVADLEDTLRRMNGQIDQLGVDLAALRRDSAGTVGAVQAANAQNAQILARLDAIDKRLSAADAARRAEAEAAANDPAQVFDKAMQLFTDNQYRAAAAGFQQYVDNFGNEKEAPEARYYLGESLFKQADYANAATAYIAAIRGWPQTAWAPDAVIKLSVSLIELRKNPDACGILAEFNTRYPRAPQALKAQAGSARTRARCGA